MINKQKALYLAQHASRFFLRSGTHASLLRPEVGIILGTGWGEVLKDKLQEVYRSISLAKVTGFDFLAQMDGIEGHKRELILGRFGGRVCVMLSGRIHVNESIFYPEAMLMVRLQVQILIEMGAKHLIFTNAAGSLLDSIMVGDVVAHNGFVTLFAPPRPLFPGEFVAPEAKLKKENNIKIINAALDAGLTPHWGSGAMVCGPDFEGVLHDKDIMQRTGASMAMMSILPEVAVAALYPDTQVYAVSFITNTASEEHSHEENQKRAKGAGAKLGSLLSGLVKSI